MVSRICFFLIGTLLITGCSSKRISERRIENDSLRRILEREPLLAGVVEVQSALDSIDANRGLEIASRDKNTGFNHIPSRLRDINQYVSQSEKKIVDMEWQLKRSVNFVSGSVLMVEALRSELDIRADEVKELRAAVEKQALENTTLYITVGNARSSLSELQEDVALTTAKLEALNEHLRMAEAEALYAKAKAVEEKARRSVVEDIDLYNEALELYEKASTLGNKEARSDADDLRKLVNLNRSQAMLRMP